MKAISPYSTVGIGWIWKMPTMRYVAIFGVYLVYSWYWNTETAAIGGLGDSQSHALEGSDTTARMGPASMWRPLWTRSRRSI